jgi:hypothetical protein
MRQIPLILQSDRLIGFTIPRNRSFFVADHDEVLRIEIGDTPNIELTDANPYDLAGQNRGFIGLHFDGAPLNHPLLRAGGSAIAYKFNPRRDHVTLTCTTPSQSGGIKFRILSGDWFCASLSDDGADLVLAEPYQLALYDLRGG